jgi:hypothetical protein
VAQVRDAEPTLPVCHKIPVFFTYKVGTEPGQSRQNGTPRDNGFSPIPMRG